MRSSISKLEINFEKLNDDQKRNFYLRSLARGEIQGPPTSKASLDRPWLKYYDDEALLFDVPSQTIYNCIYDNNKDYMDEIALEYYGRNITYRELFENVERYAKAFKANGVKENDVVTVGMLSTPEAIYTMLALNKIGAISSMIDPRSSVNGLHKYLTDNGSEYAIICDLFKPNFKKAMVGTNTKRIITSSVLDSVGKWPFNNDNLYKLDNYVKRRDSKRDDSVFIKLSDFINSGKDYGGSTTYEYVDDKPALIVHSGGTTGFPKAVVMSDKRVLSSVYQGMKSGIKFKRGENWLGIMPLFIIYGASTGTLLPLIKGITINLVPLFSPKKLPKLLKKKKPIHMTLAPSHFEYLIDNKLLEDEDLSYIVAPTVGGDKMDLKLEQRTNVWLKKHGCQYMIAKGYGSSETCSGVTINISNSCNKPGSNGIPLPKTIVSVFDTETGEELHINEPGEICVSGDTVMIEYFNSEDETDKVLKLHDDGRIWVHTGDYGYIDEDGQVFVTDRIKRMIINFGGFKILPSYIEEIIMQHPNVNNCVVFGVKDEKHVQGEVPVAGIELVDSSLQSETINEIKKMCRNDLKDSMQIPVDFYIVDALPYNSNNGKVDVSLIKQQYEKNGKVLVKKR